MDRIQMTQIDPSGIRFAAPMPDEAAWGHLHRIAALNNFDSVSELLAKWTATAPIPKPMNSRKASIRLVSLLAKGSGQIPHDYAWNHGLGFKLTAGCATGKRESVVELLGRDVLREQAHVLPERRRGRFCVSCRRQDIETMGFSWYRRIHQVGGIDFCPIHLEQLSDLPIDHERILADPAELGDLVGSDLAGGGFDSPPDVPEIRKYVDLVVWCWGDETRASLSAMYCLAQKKYRARSPSDVEWVAFEAARKLVDRAHVKPWWDFHFGGLFAERPRFRPEVSLLHLALLFAAQADTIEDLLIQLAPEQHAYRESVRRFLRGKSKPSLERTQSCSLQPGFAASSSCPGGP